MDVDEALRERLGTRHVDAPLFGIFRSKNLSCLTSMFRRGPPAPPLFVVHTGCAGAIGSDSRLARSRAWLP